MENSSSTEEYNHFSLIHGDFPQMPFQYVELSHKKNTHMSSRHSQLCPGCIKSAELQDEDPTQLCEKADSYFHTLWPQEVRGFLSAPTVDHTEVICHCCPLCWKTYFTTMSFSKQINQEEPVQTPQNYMAGGRSQAFFVNQTSPSGLNPWWAHHLSFHMWPQYLFVNNPDTPTRCNTGTNHVNLKIRSKTSPKPFYFVDHRGLDDTY